MQDVVKLMNRARISKEDLPTSMYLIFKTISEHFPCEFPRKFFVFCSKCHSYSKSSDTKQGKICENCDKKIIARETNFFVHIPIKNQLIHSIQLNWTSIQKYTEFIDNNANTNSITDVHSASLLKQLYRSFSKSEQNVISLTMNTDGANKFKSNTHSVWPIQIIQNFLPPNIRFQPKNILTVGLYYGEHKPNCMEYFEPFVTEMKELKERGVIISIEGDEYVFIPLVTHCVVDLPAKRMIQCIKQFNGRDACTYCKHPGTDVKGKKKMIRYTNGEYAPRSDIETLKSMSKKSFDSPNDGVMGMSCLVSLPKLKIIGGFGIDYMHCVCLGLTRKLMNFFINPKYHKRASIQINWLHLTAS